MPFFLSFTITGDQSFDFFFSLPVSVAILSFIVSAGISMVKGR